jgi:hypothetical protein
MVLLVVSVATLLGILIVVWRFGATRGPAEPSEPPLADWEAQGGRRAAAELRHRLGDADRRGAGDVGGVVDGVLRRLTTAQRDAVVAAVMEPPWSGHRPDAPEDR